VSTDSGKFKWLKLNYDKVVVMVMLVALMASALYLVLRIGNVRGKLTAGDDNLTNVEQREVVPVDESARNQQIADLQQHFQSGIFSNKFMVSALRVFCTNALCAKPIDYYALICPFCKVAQPDIGERDTDFDGLPDDYEIAQGMNPNDPEDIYGDIDGDGFTNIEEYNWGSDISDPDSYPSPAAKLRVFKVIERPFMMRFKSVSKSTDGNNKFQLNMRTLDKTYFVRLGDVVEGYTVESYKEDIVDTPSGKKNNSVLTLTKDGKQYPLPYNRSQKRQERFAGLVFLIDGKKYKVQIDDEIKLKGRTYKIIDISRNRVLMSDKETKKNIPVEMLSDEERMDLQGGSRVERKSESADISDKGVDQVPDVEQPKEGVMQPDKLPVQSE